MPGYAVKFSPFILTFHSLDTSGSPISFPPDSFLKLILTLKDKKIKVISLSDLVLWLNGEKELHDPCIALTFDDGFENIYHHAFPILEEHQMEATVFLTTNHIGRKNDWKNQPSNIPILPMLNWDQISEMSRSCFSFEAHTKNHPNLSQIPVEQAKEEIEQSKRDIEEHLGKSVEFFCYPYGHYNPKVYEIIKQRFKGACSTEMNFLNRGIDIYLLPRIDMYYFSDEFLFSFFLSPLFRPYIQVRNFLRKIRYGF
ncbi:MAG: polysaccharide deacetylase family protein [Calditrichaeota bacterium]|nr:MAG: polysaccharide deacetylase family protein [Calditrichota bacterium]